MEIQFGFGKQKTTFIITKVLIMNAVKKIYRISLAGYPVAAFLIRRGILNVKWMKKQGYLLIRFAAAGRSFILRTQNKQNQ
jgi:hypothetical protein